MSSPCEVRVEQGLSEPEVWLVWDDSDYYGPDLRAVCRTLDDAFGWVETNVPMTHANSRIQWYIEGVEFDAGGDHQGETP